MHAQSVSTAPYRRLEILIYLKDEPGGYLLQTTGKLYWKGDLGESYFQNCDQDALYDNADKLGEVVYIFDGGRNRVLAGITFDEFCEVIGV
jgi:hypothetical protein